MIIHVLRLRIIIQVAVNGVGLFDEPLNGVLRMTAFRTSSGMRKMGMWREPETTVLVSTIILFMTDNAQLLLGFSINRLGVIIPIAVDSPCLLKKPLRILRDLDSIRLAGALWTPLPLKGMIVRLLLEFSVYWTNNSDFLPPGLQVDLGIIIFVPMNGVRLVKEILQPFLPILIGFNTTTLRTLLSTNMRMRSLQKLAMNRANDSYLPVTTGIIDQRVIVLVAMDLASLFNKGLPRIRKGLTDFLIGTPGASFSRQVHRRTLLELAVFMTNDTHRRHAVNINHTGIVIPIPVYGLCFGNELFGRVSLGHPMIQT